eukprot:scaffold413_cov176-Ochromonas_danica.AAC.22
MSIASLCAPGTYRSTLEEDGVPCVSCPQGFWSKNYGLREKGECIKCPVGTVCSVDGMTLPCSHDDLPSSFEPIFNYNGVPTKVYLYPSYQKKTYYNYLACLQLNDGYTAGEMDPFKQTYFFGELIPPYIDVLGRGPNFRTTDNTHLKYQTSAQCYYNSQRFGSALYQRIAEYYGPQYNIQSQTPYQGYSQIFTNGTAYYDGFFGPGSLYIDLPKARHFEPSYNCTKGFRLMNESKTAYDSNGATTTVYTSSTFDPAGSSRTITMGVDQLYPGTCEADFICYFSVGNSSSAEGTACTEGYVCDEATNSTFSLLYLCRAGYVCDTGTTPETSLEATMGQFRKLCPPGYVCNDGTTLQNAYRTLCPVGYFCPTGTGDYYVGTMANDGANRDLNASIINPSLNKHHVVYLVNDDVRVMSDEEVTCLQGIDSDLRLRYQKEWLPEGEDLNNKYLLYLRSHVVGRLPYQNDPVLTGHDDGLYYRPKDINLAIKSDLTCARDGKWGLIQSVINRKECDCENFFYVVAAVYRLWKCHSDGELDDLGIAAISRPYYGGRDYWFERITRTSVMCVFPHGNNSYFNLTHGYIPTNHSNPAIGHYNYPGLLNVTQGIELQLTWTVAKNYTAYSSLKTDVVTEYDSEYSALTSTSPTRSNIDPYVFDLYNAIMLLEQYGEKLEQLIWLVTGVNATGGTAMVPGRYDMCECQNLFKCPNGTTSSTGASALSDCSSNRTEILRRISVIPTWYNKTYPSDLSGHLLNVSDYWELSGADASLPKGEETYKIGTIFVQAFEVLTVTVDLSSISYNLTYGSDYQISIYVDCKPCPARYICNYEKTPATCDYYPTVTQQTEFYNKCLDRYRHQSCMMENGVAVPCWNSSRYNDSTFMEPDLYKCQRMPFFCDDTEWPKLIWKSLVDSHTGIALDGAQQEKSTFITDPVWQKEVDSISNPDASDLYYLKTPGCCQCERYILPYYFIDDTVEEGYTDDKHGFIQLSLLMLEQSNLTIVIELLNGQYYAEFDNVIPDKSDLFLHVPNRAKYTPKSAPSRNAFLTLIQSSDFSSNSLALPFNLPMQPIRKSGSTQLEASSSDYIKYEFALKLLINRISNLYQGDPTYEDRYRTHMRDLYIENKIAEQNISFSEYATIPDLATISQSLFPVADPVSTVQYQSIWWSSVDPAQANYLALPYLPFFSNCKGSDSYISLSKVLETDPNCLLISYEDTVAVSPYPWTNSLTPNADQCKVATPESEKYETVNGVYQEFLDSYHGALFRCIYEENIAVTLTDVRWYEIPASTTLFYFGINPFSPSQYEASYTIGKDLTKTYNSYWGRTSATSSVLGTYKAIAVQTGTKSFGQVGVIPRRIDLTINYYQIDSGTKRLVKATIAFPNKYMCVALTTGGATQKALLAKGITQCVLDSTGAVASSEYLLQIFYEALGWFDLLNSFQFTPPIYILIFFLTGMITVGSAAFIWLVNRLLTKLRHPPPFHGYSMTYALAQPSLFGICLATGPIMFAVLVFYAWFMLPSDGGTICNAAGSSSLCLQNIIDWKGTADADVLIQGRQQLAILALCAYIIVVFTNLVVPNYTDDDRKTDVQRAALKQKAAQQKAAGINPATNKAPKPEEEDDEDEIPPSDAFKPYIWRRATLLFLSTFTVFCLMVQMEFSYSNTFQDLVYQFILVFKVIWLLVEVGVFSQVLPDNLHYAPMLAAINTVSDMTTMGASNLVTFILSYIASLYMGFVQSLYVDPYLSEMINMWPRWRMMLQRRFRGNKRLTRDEKAREELEWRRINEEIELANEGIEPLLDSLAGYAGDVTGRILAPITYACLQLFYNQNMIAPNYQILENQTVYYITFAVMCVPFYFLSDTFIQNCQELIHGWKIFDYLSYQRYRFSVREYRWMLRNPVVDESISEEFQTVDQLCFSSQYYFLLGLLSFSMVQMVMAITGFLRLNYNPFGDKAFCLIFIIVFLIGELMRYFYALLADIKVKRFNWRGLWATKQIEGTVDDDVAAKLAIGEGKQADLEQERLELQALNSERFRHRFLERNRPWILQHLVDLLTPRSLEQPGPDGRPAIEYVRDVYAELMAMGEGLRRPGDREDISSDEEDELEAIRRNWPREPVTGASLAIARMWLAKARKRRTFAKLIRGIIEQNKKTLCEVCGRTPEKNKVKLTAYLATRAEPDLHAIDRLIAGFEDQYGVNEVEPQLWKAYFRAHAEYCTRCSICEDSMAQERLLQAGREPGPSRLTRPQDISSDEEEDMVDFEPVVVTRTSPEGRMMSKWLLAARRKLGGVFPRPDARRQMERYAQKLRELKMKKARDRLAQPSKTAPDDVEGETMAVSAATKALALRWIRLARDHMDSKFRMRSETFREDLTTILQQMPEEDDWYFGAALRLEGRDLLKKGSDLEDDRRTLEAEAAVKVHKIETDLKDYLKDREDELDRERKLFINKLAQQNDRIRLDIELRKQELEKLKEGRKKEFQAVERKAREELGAAPTEMIQDHRAQLLAIDEQMASEQANTEQYRSQEEQQARVMFDRTEQIKRNEMERRRAMAAENIARIRQEVAVKVKAAEAEWQVKAAKWLAIGRRKVQVKKKEDEEAKAGKRKRKGGK